MLCGLPDRGVQPLDEESEGPIFPIKLDSQHAQDKEATIVGLRILVLMVLTLVQAGQFSHLCATGLAEFCKEGGHKDCKAGGAGLLGGVLPRVKGQLVPGGELKGWLRAQDPKARRC
jgi:hypothetical protein